MYIVHCITSNDCVVCRTLVGQGTSVEVDGVLQRRKLAKGTNTRTRVCVPVHLSDCLNWSIKGPIDVIVGKVKHKAFKHRIRAKSESY